MPIQLGPMLVPETPVNAEGARPLLKDFVSWFREFLHQVTTDPYEGDISGNLLFEEPLIHFFKDALNEAEEHGHFEEVLERLESVSASSLRAHGLQGFQLNWKLSNINHWFVRFIGERTSALFERLLTSIDALLKSLLGAVGVGDALEELKEAVLNSTALATE